MKVPSRLPSIRHCPVCGIAMQASRSREDLPHFDTFQCLTCQTTISEGSARSLSPDGVSNRRK